jgi:hypothetical protein
MFLIFLHDDCAWYATSKDDFASRSATILSVLPHYRDVVHVQPNLAPFRGHPRGHGSLSNWLTVMHAG